MAIGGWRLAVGDWRLVAIGGWRLAVGGDWRLAVGDSWRLAVGGDWRLAVGGWRLAVGGDWRLAVGGSWRLVAVGGPLGQYFRSLKKNSSFQRTPLGPWRPLPWGSVSPSHPLTHKTTRGTRTWRSCEGRWDRARSRTTSRVFEHKTSVRGGVGREQSPEGLRRLCRCVSHALRTPPSECLTIPLSEGSRPTHPRGLGHAPPRPIIRGGTDTKGNVRRLRTPHATDEARGRIDWWGHTSVCMGPGPVKRCSPFLRGPPLALWGGKCIRWRRRGTARAAFEGGDEGGGGGRSSQPPRAVRVRRVYACASRIRRRAYAHICPPPPAVLRVLEALKV